MLEKPAYDYVAGGAGSEETVRANREAFRRWRIVPRFLRTWAAAIWVSKSWACGCQCP